MSGVAKVHQGAEQIEQRDVAGLQELVTVSEDFLASGYLLVRHLYVEDGDLKAQDKTQKEIDALTAEAREALAALGPRLDGAEAKRIFSQFERGVSAFQASSAKRSSSPGGRPSTASRSATVRARCTRTRWRRSSSASACPTTSSRSRW